MAVQDGYQCLGRYLPRNYLSNVGSQTYRQLDEFTDFGRKIESIQEIGDGFVV